MASDVSTEQVQQPAVTPAPAAAPAPASTPSSEPSEWGSMSPEERKASLAKISTTPTGDEPAQDEPSEPSAGGDETPAADDAAETPAGEGEGEEAGDWLDQETRDFAGTMGLTDEDLAEFGSREELDRAMRIIDRKAYAAGKEASKPAETPAPKPIEPAKPAATATPPGGDPFADLTAFKLGDELGADDAKPIKSFIETTAATIRDLQARVAQFEQRDRQTAVENLRNKAVESLHSLGHAELFGKPGERPTKEQQANIEKAVEAHIIHARGLFATGRQAAPTPAFLKAAVNLVFGDQIVDKTKKEQIAKLQKQSSRRTGGPGAKHVPRTAPDNETEEQYLRRIASDPELAALRKRFFVQET